MPFWERFALWVGFVPSGKDLLSSSPVRMKDENEKEGERTSLMTGDKEKYRQMYN